MGEQKAPARDEQSDIFVESSDIITTIKWLLEINETLSCCKISYVAFKIARKTIDNRILKIKNVITTLGMVAKLVATNNSLHMIQASNSMFRFIVA